MSTTEAMPTLDELESEPEKRKVFNVNVRKLYRYMRSIPTVAPHIRWSIPGASFIYYKPTRGINYRYSGNPVGVKTVRTTRRLPFG